jgi:hypothetical protein
VRPVGRVAEFASLVVHEMTPEELISQVKDEKSFMHFVRALEADRRTAVSKEPKSKSSPYGPDAGGWENVTIEAFLESAAAWAEDTHFGKSTIVSGENPWRKFAQFLLAGKLMSEAIHFRRYITVMIPFVLLR